MEIDWDQFNFFKITMKILFKPKKFFNELPSNHSILFPLIFILIWTLIFEFIAETYQTFVLLQIFELSHIQYRVINVFRNFLYWLINPICIIIFAWIFFRKIDLSNAIILGFYGYFPVLLFKIFLLPITDNSIISYTITYLSWIYSIIIATIGTIQVYKTKTITAILIALSPLIIPFVANLILMYTIGPFIGG